MDNAQKITLVKILDLGQRLVNELELDSVTQIAFKNVLYEMVEKYHLFFGMTARTLVQKLLYAMVEAPGDHILRMRLHSDISTRMDRDHCKTGGMYRTLRYEIPLNDLHLKDNPPMRRVAPVSTENKSTQTNGTCNEKPVLALIMEN